MRKRGISTRDMNRLSAYLDDALSDKERTRFDMHLAQSKEMQLALANHKRLKAALRALPVKKAPRDFMLTEEMVRLRKPRASLFPAFRLASAVVAFLLIAVFAGEYLLKGGLFGGTPESQPKEMPVAMESDSAGGAPEIIFWGSNEALKGMGGGGVEGGVGGASTAPETSMLVPPVEEPAITDLQPEITQDTLTMEAAGEALEPAILGLRLEEGGQVISSSSDEMVKESSRFALPFIRWLEIGLGALALGLGITSYILYSKKRAW